MSEITEPLAAEQLPGPASVAQGPRAKRVAAKKPRRRLLYLLAGVLCVAAIVGLGYKWRGDRALREERAFFKLRSMQAEPLYESEAGLTWTPPKPGPLGTPAYRQIVRFGVSVNYDRPFIVSADVPKLIPLLRELPRLDKVIFERCDLSREDLDALHRALPSVTISYCSGRPADSEVIVIGPESRW